MSAWTEGRVVGARGRMIGSYSTREVGGTALIGVAPIVRPPLFRDPGPPAPASTGIRFPCAHADARSMTDKKRRPAKKRQGSHHRKSPYFLQPAKQGTVTVFRRPAGNRIDPKLCGTMTSRAMALALVKQLEKPESV